MKQLKMLSSVRAEGVYGEGGEFISIYLFYLNWKETKQ